MTFWAGVILKQRVALTRPAVKDIVVPAKPMHNEHVHPAVSVSSTFDATTQQSASAAQQTHMTIMPRSSSEIVIGFS